MAELRYARQQIDEDDIAAVVRVLRSDWLTCGPEVKAFEQELAAYVGAKYAVAVSSGTAALHLAYLVSGKAGLMTSPLSFVATANAGLLANSQMDIMFHDVDPATGNVDLGHHSGVLLVPVHYAGRAAPLPIQGRIIEDGCHALGAMDFDGCSRVGSCAHSLATCFSFYPVKPITTGEGGAVTTNDEGFAEEVRLLRSHGRDASGQMVKLSGNYRMTDIQAALGRSQLERCDEMRERRLDLAWRYYARMDWSLLSVPPCVGREAWHLFPVRIKNGKRDAVKAALNAQGIGAQVHYSPIIPLQPYYRERFGYREGMFPEAEAWASEELSLPLHARMTEADVDRVVTALKEALS